MLVGAQPDFGVADEDQLDPAPLRMRTRFPEHLLDHGPQVDPCPLERYGARFELRKLEELLDEPAEPLDLAERGLQGRALDGLDPVDEVFEQGPEGADGGA